MISYGVIKPTLIKMPTRGSFNASMQATVQDSLLGFLRDVAFRRCRQDLEILHPFRRCIWQAVQLPSRRLCSSHLAGCVALKKSFLFLFRVSRSCVSWISVTILSLFGGLTYISRQPDQIGVTSFEGMQQNHRSSCFLQTSQEASYFQPSSSWSKVTRHIPRSTHKKSVSTLIVSLMSCYFQICLINLKRWYSSHKHNIIPPYWA